MKASPIGAPALMLAALQCRLRLGRRQRLGQLRPKQCGRTPSGEGQDDGRDIGIDSVGGAKVGRGIGTKVDIAGGDVRAAVRADDNRSISISSSQH